MRVSTYTGVGLGSLRLMRLVPRTLARAALFDIAAVIVFVTVGRRSHDEDGSVVGGIATVAAPFLLALVAGWYLARAWRSPGSLRTGLQVWLITVALGMVLRNVVFGKGTAPSFVVVATIVLGALLLGWRLAAPRLARLRR
jgi:uncharacterized membrane protein (GlpM family)